MNGFHLITRGKNPKQITLESFTDTTTKAFEDAFNKNGPTKYRRQ